MFLMPVDEREEEIAEGTLIRKTCDRIIPHHSNECRTYYFPKQLQALIDSFPTGCTMSGEFLIKGEDNKDIRRVFIDAKGKVIVRYAPLHNGINCYKLQPNRINRYSVVEEHSGVTIFSCLLYSDARRIVDDKNCELSMARLNDN